MDALTSLFHQYTKPLATAATFILVILMAISLANGAVFFIEQYNQAEVTSNPRATTQAPTKALDTTQIRDLFGRFQSTVVAQTVDAPKTTLNLELQGIFTADEAKDSTAIVAQRGQSGELYRIGDRLPGNATLEAVFSDHILIKRGSRTEKLPFADSLIGAGFSQTSTPAATLGNNVVLSPDPNIGNTPTKLEQVRERIARRSQELARERGQTASQGQPDLRGAIDSFQERLDQDPEALFNEIGISPVETGNGSGYRIGGEVSQTMLRQAGLQQGDVIVSVNGQSATSVANDRNLINQVMESERARVEVQRGDRRFFVTVPIPN
jgi:general secretion pathway protein C